MADHAKPATVSTTRVTPEVGDEGGTPGNVELGEEVIGTGSEAGETWRPETTEEHEVVRDETGRGRRSP